MTKKYLLVGAMAAAFLAVTTLAQAPAQKLSNPTSIEKMVISDEIFGRYAKEAERKFLHSFYPGFPYADELLDIIKHAKLVGVEPELLMAIRLEENGADSLAYGIVHEWGNKKSYEKDKGYMDNGILYFYKDEKEKQLHKAAQTVRFYLNQFEKNPPKKKDFISYLASQYCPVGLNDRYGLNKYWGPNVRHYYKSFKKN